MLMWRRLVEPIRCRRREVGVVRYAISGGFSRWCRGTVWGGWGSVGGVVSLNRSGVGVWWWYMRCAGGDLSEGAVVVTPLGWWAAVTMMWTMMRRAVTMRWWAMTIRWWIMTMRWLSVRARWTEL